MVIHCRAMAPFAEVWRRIHTRQTYKAPGVRFYTNAGNDSYSPTRDSAAEAITRQALEPIDFPRRCCKRGTMVFGFSRAWAPRHFNRA